jgi:hypothetical protein
MGKICAQLDWALLPRLLVNHYSGFFCEGIFLDEIYVQIDFE